MLSFFIPTRRLAVLMLMLPVTVAAVVASSELATVESNVLDALQSSHASNFSAETHDKSEQRSSMTIDSTSRSLRKSSSRTFPLPRVRSFRVSRLELFNSVTNKKVQNLLNGAVINVNDLGMATPSFNIRATLRGTRPAFHSVWFAHNSNQKYHQERSEPYFFCGQTINDKPSTCNVLGYGTHTVTATPYVGMGLAPGGPSMSVTFVIEGPSKAPSPVAPAAPTAPTPTIVAGNPSVAGSPSIAGPAVQSPSNGPGSSPSAQGGSGPTTQSPAGGGNGSPSENSPAAQGPSNGGGSPATAPSPANGGGGSPTVNGPSAQSPSSGGGGSPAPTARPTSAPTLAPTPCPSLEEYINSVTLSNRTVTMIGTTAEDEALQWLALDDPLELQPCPDKFRLRQRFALLTLWFQRDSSLWINTTNWLTADDECTWFAVKCALINVGNGEGLQMAVTELSFGENDSLGGTFPSDLGLLSSLVTVDLPFNYQAEGTLPDTVGSWTNLQRLTATYFGGTLPNSIANWTAMKHAHFPSCSISGSLPPLVGQWTDLEFVNLGCDFTGTLPSSIGQWNKVKHVSFYTRFSGALPDAMSQWTALESLSLAYNELNGTLPSWIESWTNLTTLYANYNQFTGTLPSSLSALTKLDLLELQDNSFRGTLPAAIGQLTKLTSLDLGRNIFTGTLPESLGDLANITFAFFKTNKFNGTLPPGLCGEGRRIFVDPTVNCTCCVKN